MMKRVIKYVILSSIVIYGMILLTANWAVYKEFFFEIVDKVYRSDFERSLEQDNIKIKDNPNDPWNYIYRGETYKKYKMYNESLKDFMKAYELKNSFFIVLDDISNVYLALGNPSKAYEFINKFFKKAPSPDRSFFDLALIYDYEWKSKEALDIYTKYITKNNIEKGKDKYIFSLKRRVIHYTLQKEYDKAKEDIETLFKENPEDKDVVALKVLLSDTNKINDSIIHEKFKLDVHEAIVGTTQI